MNQIDDATWAEINGALRDVTDTFARLAVTYVIRKGTTSIMQTDNVTQATDSYALDCFCEPDSKDATKNEKGVIDYNGSSLMFNYDYLNEQGLILPSKEPKFNPATDHVIVRGTKYRVDGVTMDGQLKDKPVLVYVKLIKYEKNG